MAFGMEFGWRRVALSAAPAQPVEEQAETAVLVARMDVPPSATRRGQIDALIAGLKGDGVWAKLDWLCLLAAHDAQAGRLNWVKPTKALAAVNSPVFTVDRGYAGDGATSYLGLGEYFLAAGSRFAQNSASVGAWCNQQAGAAGYGAHVGTTSSSATYVYTQLLASDETLSDTYRLNSTASVMIGAGTTRIGHRTATRPSSTMIRAYREGVLTLETASQSVGVPPLGEGCLLHRWTDYTQDRLAAFYAGASMSDAEVAAIHGRLRDYLTTVGAQ